MPQKLVASVGLGLSNGSPQPRGDADACAFSVRHRIDDFAASVGAVAAGKKLWMRGLPGSAVNHDAAPFQFNFFRQADLGRLPNSQDNQIPRERKFRPGSRNDRSVSGCFEADQLNRLHGFVTEDARGLCMPQKLHSLEPRVLVFKGECRHLLRTPPVHDVYVARPQPDGRDGGIDGRVSRTDDDHFWRASL